MRPGSRRSSSAAAASRLAPGRLLDGRAALQRLPPLAVVRIPAHRLLEPGVEVDGRAPAELPPDLGPVEQVAAVLPRPVRDAPRRRGGRGWAGEGPVPEPSEPSLESR